MAEGTRCVREITVFSSNQRSRLVEFNVGAQPSTKIRDDETFKFHVGGGYGYVPSSQSSSISGNRFIYWRISENILELIEESLDVNLSGNCLKIRFLDSTLVPGLSVFETPTSICILVATTNSVHRIVFTHPNKLHGHMFGLSYDQTAPSIFSTISMSDLREPWNFATFSQCCVTSSAWLCQDGHSLFALATEMGSILLVKLPPNGIHGEPEIFELQQSSMMQRLWSGLVPSSLRGDASLPDGIIDLQIHSLGQQMCIFTLCRDHKIRIWSCQKQECISVKDVLEDVPDDVDSSAVNAQNHKMRICFDYKTERLYVGIFLALQYQNQFCVYEALVDGKDVYLSSVSNLYAATGSLVDFSLTSSEIWAQWNTNDGESMTSFTTFENSESDSGWSKVLCSSDTGSLAIVVPSHQEPKEVYLAELFYPGRFDDQAIVKSLQIYQHGVQPGFSPDDRTELRQQVINLIDTEIQLSASNCELNYSEYYELQLSCWEKFFSCVVQYQQAASQAIGLFVDKTTNLVVAIKKDMLSVLKDCEGAEKLYLLPVIEDVNTFGQELLLNKSLKKGLLSVYNSIRHISHQLSNANKVDIENDLKYGCNPTQLACQIADSLVSNESDYDQQPTDSRSEWILELETSLQGVSNLLECFEMVIRLLDLSGIQVEENSSGSVLLGSHPKFGSHFMHNILSLSYMQTMETYMLMCRDFLVFLAVVDRLGSRAGVNPNFSQDISSVYIPKVVLLLRVYHCLHWISKLDVTQAPSNAIESNLKQLAALEISDGNQVKLSEDYPKTTVLKLFLRKVGGSQLQLLMSKIQKTNQQFDSIPISVLINQAVLCLAGSIWPTNPSVVLPEFLLTNYQYLHLQDYCHLIESWCDVSQTYRQFLSGQSYLILGENLKALDCFLHAAQGIDVDDCLMQNFLQADTTNKESLAVLFYVKVMRLFEQFDVPDMVIAVANTAISTASPDDPNIPNLWSNIFKHHLQLGHNDDAYAALTSNPDISRKRDCLHRFMVVLCERGQLQELCEYPYVNLHDEFVDIMESHARTIDITTHQYYDLLYAFHVFRGNYRKAGSVMYEYGGRLGRELAGKNGLQKQAKCYLAAINALQLVDPKNAWIVTPWDREQKKKTEEPPNTSPKRKHGDEEAWYGVDRRKRTKRKLTIVELKDLEKEYMLVLARLQLLRLDADPSQGTGPPLTADETMTLLIQAGLYDTAFTLASSFNLPREAIFEGITARCVRHSFNIGLTSRSGGIDNKEAWEWLLENDTGKTQPSHDKRIADQAWQLLQSYLEKLKDTVNSPVYYRCVVTKLLTMGAPLPTWLTNHYKRLNPSELLYVLVSYDMLQEAADLAIEYISAVLGEGKEYFGLKSGLHATMPSVWLPYTTLDHLLIALEEASPNSNLAKMYDKLVDKLEQYHEQVTRVSEDMITTAWKRAHRRHMSESLPWQ